MKAAVVIYPGSNCDRDTIYVLQELLGCPVQLVWHTEHELQGAHLVVLPGGFSYGDYMRPGALAARAQIMPAVISHAKSGKPVLGICNGFQVLTECGLLPGALLQNRGTCFLCQDAYISVMNIKTPFTNLYRQGQTLRLSIAHADGRYYAEPEQLLELEANNQVIFRYTDGQGEPLGDGSPNGSALGIAGITNAAGNVLGMMPHPERHCEGVLGGSDGRWLFESVISSWKGLVN